MTKLSGGMRCLFGTDGVRDVANRGTMTPEMVMCLGRAFVFFLVERGIPCPKIAIGMDTRRSGAMLEAALIAGMTSAGAQLTSLGIFPTPGVSYITREGDFDAGAIISASHNPAEYNGIKFLDSTGCKLSDEDEYAIEEYIGDDLVDEWRPTGASIGQLGREKALRGYYIDWLRNLAKQTLPLSYGIIVDAANGAASEIVKDVFSDFGENITLCGISPDGLNINEGVGVMHMQHLTSRVIQQKAKLGIAFDGDTDRVLMCDYKGRVIDGDLILWIIAVWLKNNNLLGNGVVATVMSNMILDEKLKKADIAFFRSDVGDRYVLEMMKNKGCSLGGEQSGHIIALDYATTGDGFCTALLFMRACNELEEDINTLNDRFVRYPQLLKNINLENRDKILAHPNIQDILQEANNRLGMKGRVLVRPSGTEPLIRVMVEAKDRTVMEEVSSYLVDGIHNVRDRV